MAEVQAARKSLASGSAAGRRAFLRWFGVLLGGGVSWQLLGSPPEHPPVRPPGGNGPRLASACIHCGHCLAVCDRKALDLDRGGLPSIDPIQGWCDFCLRCIEVCPTGALETVDPQTAVIAQAQIDTENCIAYRWMGCQLCAKVCDSLRQALPLNDLLQPQVLAERCNGCGACVHVCPVELSSGFLRPAKRAIEILPLAQGGF